jgi:DNA-binding GntR family transcriptional regulator
MVMMLAEQVTDEQIGTLRGLVDRMDAIAPTGEVSRYYPINLEFHAELAKMSANRRLAQIYQSLVRELHVQRYRALGSGDVLPISNAEHRAILNAVSARDPSRAFQAARSHILNGIVRTQKARERTSR